MANKPAKNFLKSSPELSGEESIHARVDSRVTVSKPDEGMKLYELEDKML